MKRSILCLIGALGLLLGSCYARSLQLTLSGGVILDDAKTGVRVVILGQDEEYEVAVISEGVLEQLDLAAPAGTGLHQQGRERSVSIVDGKTEMQIKQSYLFRPTVAGQYTLGPARAMVDGKAAKSNTVSFRVVSQDEYDTLLQKATGHKRKTVSCEFSLSSEHVMVGEPVIATITLKNVGPVRQRSLDPPHFKGVSYKEIPGQEEEERIINGERVTLVKKRYRLFPDTPGTVTFDPVVAQFLVPEEEARDPFSGFFNTGLSSLFGGFKKRVVRSNLVTLDVVQLPPSDKPYDGVGRFTDFSLSADMQSVKVNEPITLKVQLTGTGNFDAVLPPVLVLPQSMTTYDSANDFVPASERDFDTGTKTFEFILQISKPGEHTIGPQEFRFFDTHEHSYRSLRSKPLTFTVRRVSAAVVPSSVTSEESAEPVRTKAESPSLKKEPAGSQRSSSWLSGIMQQGIAWYWFVVGLLLLVGFFLRKQIVTGLFSTTEFLGITSQYKRDTAELRRIIAAENAVGLHAFFFTLLGRVLANTAESITASDIEKAVGAWGWESGKKELFLAYIDLCSQAAFAHELVSASQQKELFARAQYWFDLLSALEFQKDV